MNWKALQQLHQIYTEGETPNNILKYQYIRRLAAMDYIALQDTLLVKTDLFDNFYKRKHLDKFEHIQNMLAHYDFVTTNLKENDLEILLKIEQDKDIVLHEALSKKEISTRYFNNSKYLKTDSKLHEIILKILDVETLRRDEHDQQYLYVLHAQSKTPKAIILCENDNLLRKPRLAVIELWYAGGNNTAKLAYVPKSQIPMYYLCDWDNKGIEIYQRIKRNYLPDIQLIVPTNTKFLSVKSEWKTHIEKSFFTKSALQLLKYLEENNLWIEEESIKIPKIF